jgi:hypothetical protein
MNHEYLFIVLIVLYIIDKISFNFIETILNSFINWCINKLIYFNLKKSQKKPKEEFIGQIIQPIISILKMIPPISWIISIIEAVLSMVQILFDIVLLLFSIVDKVGICLGAATSIGTASSSTKSTLKASIKWVKLVTYMVKTATKLFFSPDFWSNQKKIGLLGKMLCDVRNQSYVTDKLKEVSLANSKDAISKSIGKQGCLDLDVMIGPLKNIGAEVPKVVQPLISIFKFITPIIGGMVPGSPAGASPDSYKPNMGLLDLKYSKLSSQKCPLAGSIKNDKDDNKSCPSIV